MFGCLRRGLIAVVVIALLAAGWYYRAELLGVWQHLFADDEIAAVSPELAQRAESKLARLRIGPARVALTEAEVQSLVRFRIAPTLPSFILTPQVRLEGGGVSVRARVPMDEVRDLPGIPGSSELIDMLPDTTAVEAYGQIIPLGAGRVALAVENVSAAKIPLPERVIPTLLRGVGRVDEPGLPPTALAVTLPTGATHAFVHRDSLVFLSAGASAADASGAGSNQGSN